jgi:hypothetical protein
MRWVVIFASHTSELDVFLVGVETYVGAVGVGFHTRLNSCTAVCEHDGGTAVAPKSLE